ncbi:TetR/AcrR family transcriptional regulator [Leucobacter chromiireducens]|uniref:TetR family transcriptional regulator n=1 Tax=Leucobacter chromiireducens subsp. solipictus TaxID=398235 RepID=A0ABS1SJK3_9MICO|nr:TetR family transcriptional regulator [Leucobacter chromiireducens]MBL3680556.1 TetR family transcriptional regulator [Leucobacter chromiireducens subsp. solipictus]
MRNSLADVVVAALRVLDAQGLENCSMRRVAAELDVQPSALYHHVPNKQSLLALMADQIVQGVGPRTDRALAEVPVAARLDAARRLCGDLREAMLAVRDGADVVATATAFRTGRSRVEDELAKLVGGDAARTLMFFTFGHAQSTQTHRQAAALGALVGEQVASAAPVPGGEASPAGSDLDASFGRGIELILGGLVALQHAPAVDLSAPSH